MSRWHGGIAAAAILFLAGCASGGGVGNTDATTYTHSLGRITYATLDGGLQRILPKYNFAVRRREEQFATIFIETDWRLSDPTDEEIAQGVVAARTRFIINGRRSDGPVFRTTLTAEHHVRTQNVSDWHEMPLTSDRRSDLRGIVLDLEAEVRTGGR